MEKTNEEEVEWNETSHGENEYRYRGLSSAAGTDTNEIGFSLYEIPPGKRSCPYHYHTANEEAIFVLEGEGTLRHSDGEADLNPGDFAAFPADEEGGHQVVNDSDATLRYVMVSTMEEPDVIVYPETDKFGVFVGSPPGGSEDERSLYGFYKTDDDVGYWE